MKVVSLSHVHNFKVYFHIADELEKPEPLTVNIRERAGWSKDTKSSSKIAALMLQASNEPPPIKTVPIQSDGRCLIYGGGRKRLGTC